MYGWRGSWRDWGGWDDCRSRGDDNDSGWVEYGSGRGDNDSGWDANWSAWVDSDWDATRSAWGEWNGGVDHHSDRNASSSGGDHDRSRATTTAVADCQPADRSRATTTAVADSQPADRVVYPPTRKHTLEYFRNWNKFTSNYQQHNIALKYFRDRAEEEQHTMVVTFPSEYERLRIAEIEHEKGAA